MTAGKARSTETKRHFSNKRKQGAKKLKTPSLKLKSPTDPSNWGRGDLKKTVQWKSRREKFIKVKVLHKKKRVEIGQSRARESRSQERKA